MSRLRELREAKGLTGARLAELAGTSQPQIWRLETGARKLTKIWAETLAPHLGVTPQELLFEAAPDIDHPERIPADIEPSGFTSDQAENLKNKIYVKEHKYISKQKYPDVEGKDISFLSTYLAPDGTMIIRNEWIDFAKRPWFMKRGTGGAVIILSGTTMEPAYYAGDYAIISPTAVLAKGKDVMVMGVQEKKETPAVLGQYVGEDQSSWVILRHNPPEGEEKIQRLLKEEWPRAMRVVAKYDGG